jgi:hypothetical protein
MRAFATVTASLALTLLARCAPEPSTSNERQATGDATQDEAASLALGNARAAICAGVTGDTTGRTAVGAALQNCINRTPAGGTLALPAGTYLLDRVIEINKPMVLRTAGTKEGTPGCYNQGQPRAGVPCATLRIANGFVPPAGSRGFVHVAATAGVVLSHLIVDGNLEGRAAARTNGICANTVTCPSVFFDFCNSGTYNDPLSGNARVSFGSGDASQRCAFVHGALINAIGMGAIVVKRSLNFLLSDTTVMNNGRFLKRVPGDTLGGSDGITTEDHVDGLWIVGNYFLDNTDGSISINGGARFAYIAGNTIVQKNESVANGMVLARLPFEALDTGNWTGSVVENNVIDGCARPGHTGCVTRADEINCAHNENSYMQTGIFIGSDGWTHQRNDIPVAGWTVRNNVINRVSRGIQLAGVGRPGVPSVLAGNTVANLRVLPNGFFMDCHMSGRRSLRGAGIAWCQNSAPGECNAAIGPQRQDFGSIVGLIGGNNAPLNASLDYFDGL